MLCFLVTFVVRFALLPYYQRIICTEYFVSFVSLFQFFFTLFQHVKSKIQHQSQISISVKLFFLADSRLNAAKSAAVPDQKQLNLFSNIYLWIMKTYVYLHIYYGDKLLSETVCNNLLQSLQGVTQDEFLFLKCLSKIVGKEQNISSMIENMRMMSTIATRHMSASLWKVCYFYSFHVLVIILKKMQLLAYSVTKSCSKYCLQNEVFL